MIVSKYLSTEYFHIQLIHEFNIIAFSHQIQILWLNSTNESNTRRLGCKPVHVVIFLYKLAKNKSINF